VDEGFDVYGNNSGVIGPHGICSLWNQIKRRCVKFNTAMEKNYKFIYSLSLRIVQPLAKGKLLYLKHLTRSDLQ
jgi:hypothetical protein